MLLKLGFGNILLPKKGRLPWRRTGAEILLGKE